MFICWANVYLINIKIVHVHWTFYNRKIGNHMYNIHNLFADTNYSWILV